MSLYTDRGSHYFRTTKAGEIDRAHRPWSGGRWRNRASSTSALFLPRPEADRSAPS